MSRPTSGCRSAHSMIATITVMVTRLTALSSPSSTTSAATTMRKRSAQAAITCKPQLTVSVAGSRRGFMWGSSGRQGGSLMPACRGREVVELLAQETCHHVEVRHQLAARDQPEVEAAAIAHHRDVQPLPVDQSRHRVVVQHLGAGEIERYFRPGNVGD